MKKLLTLFWQEEDGMGTVELVIIIGVLVAIALVFRERLTLFATGLMDKYFKES